MSDIDWKIVKAFELEEANKLRKFGLGPELNDYDAIDRALTDMDPLDPPCLDKLEIIPDVDEILRAQLKERVNESNMVNAVVQIDVNGNLLGVICGCTTEICQCGLGECINSTTSCPTKPDHIQWGKRPCREMTEEEERRVERFLADPPNNKRARLSECLDD